jgi:hypothetical protein
MDASWRKNYLRYKSFFLNIMAQYKERSDWKAYLEILLSLGTVTIFSIFALKPTILTIAELLKQIEEKKATVIQMDEKIKNISLAQTLFDKQRINIQLLQQTAIPKSSNADVFARQIEGLSVRHSVNLNNISLGKVSIVGPQTQSSQSAIEIGLKPLPNDSGQMSYLIVLETSIGNYQGLANYLSDFENLRTPPKIDRIEFAIIEKTGGEEPENMTITIAGRMPYLIGSSSINK